MATPPAASASRDLETATPEQVGMDSARLDRVTAAMQDLVDQGLLAGVVTMVARDSKIVHFESVGYRDIESGDPMSNDALFRIYSMTKPITGVALMTLYEEGKFRLADPVEKYIPQLKGLKVAAGVDADGNLLTEEADHPMTIRELMSHTGGLTYGIFSQSKVDEMYVEADMLNTDSTLEDMINKLADIPLRQQPGTQWHYSVSVDVQGYLVEVLSGQRFDEFLQERLFEPLGMHDTGFYVTPEKASRFAQVYGYDENGNLVAQEGFGGAQNWLEPVNFLSGGGGLVSSAMDYMRFSQMVLNGGELDGVRILSPMTVALMQRNQLPRGMPDNILGAPGTVFGLDFAVTANPVEAETYSKGEFYWGGAAGTWFWIDPVEDLVFVGMIQQFGSLRPDVRSLARRLTYQAIMEPRGI
ncbi:MAG: serine hydrolase domain-containing protein [Pseudomonadales bacterium]|nr:serine hydrolase domain-containing protein [Pseudomonadales bacterium]